MTLPILAAYSAFGFLALRLILASVFVYHGLPKVKNSKMMAQGMGFPSWFVLGLGLVEILSAISVGLGVYSYLGALAMVVVMLGALYHKIIKWKVPFWAMDKAGWEADLVILGGALVLVLSNYGLTLL